MSAVIPSSGIVTATGRNDRKVAPGQSSRAFQEALAAAAQSIGNPAARATQPPPAAKSYAVLTGDTLSEIVAAQSKKLGISHSTRELYAMVDQIAARNQLSDPDKLMPGQQLDLSGLTRTSRHQTGPIFPEPATPLRFPQPTPNTQTGPALPPSTAIQSPLTGAITSLFGMRTHPILGETLHHDGIDISRPTGTPVKPVSAGVVTFAGEKGGYGLMVEVEHANGLTSRYAHLSALTVRAGDHIDLERTIGRVGQTGRATGPHLHLEILHRKIPIDPLTVLDRHQIEPELLVAQTRNTHRR